MATTGNLKLQQAALTAAGEGELVITATGRLARHLLHRWRLGSPPGTRQRAQIVPLKAWMHEAWLGLWPQEALAPAPLRLRLWQRACAAAAPPEPLEPTLGLFSQLDEAYAVLVRHGLDPGRRLPGPPLAEWRAEACAHFERLTGEAGLLHPTQLPARLTEAVLSGRLRPPPLTLLAISAPAPAEERLFSSLGAACRLTRRAAPPQQARPHLVSLPRLRDEVEWCAARVLEAAAQVPPHQIGIVVPSMDDYGPELDRALGELLGRRCAEGWSAYNIAAPRPLSEAPLVRAALLPLRFLVEEEPRELLLALVTSAHYGRWRGVRPRVARADRNWRRLSVERGLRRLLSAAGGARLSRLIEGDAPTLSDLLGQLRGRASLRVWLERLRTLWRGLGFPELGEAEAGARDRLAEVLERLELAGGEEVFGLGELFSWLEHALAAELVDRPGFEHAGVQVLGLIEAGGLHFERLFVLGLHERGLPRPARALPLLRADERARVRGGTWESQLAFARTALSDLLAAGGETWLVRPRLAADDEPLLASPLWPEPAEERPEGAPWPGFPWLEAAQATATPAAAPEFAAQVQLPVTLPATALENLLGCPFLFLVQNVLGLEPLAEPRPGISPLERGERLHRVLSCFTAAYREAGGGLAVAEALLEECVGKVLADVEHDPFWGLERRRWLGEGGLLRAWLAAEGGRLAACLAEECPFSHLSWPGWPFEVRGTIDRLDQDGEGESGLVCWDYKTGSRLAPGHSLLDHPQLAAYGLALRAGLLAEEFKGRPLAALGYLHLPSAGRVAVRRLAPERGLEAALAEFASEVGRRAKGLSEGRFAPDWARCAALGRRERERCPFRALCGLLERLEAAQEEEP